MSDLIDRRIPDAYDINEPSQVRICPDKIGLSGFRELVRKNFQTTDQAIPVHIHPDAIELCYAYRGAQYYSTDVRAYSLQAGDVFMTYPNEIHSSGGCTQEKGSVLYYMIVDTLNERDRFVGLGPSEGPLLASLLGNLPRHFHVGYSLKPYFDEMIRIYTEKPPLGPLLLRSQLCLLIDQLHTAASQGKRAQHSDIQRALDIIEDRLPAGLEIVELAEMLHMSESYFKQKFRQDMGFPPAKYIMQRRIALSQQLLSQGQSVTATAYELGFSSSQHFATVFKAYTRQTPSAWRSEHCDGYNE